MKKYVSLILVASILAAVGSGCGTYEYGAESKEVSVLKILKPNNIADFSDIVNSFNESNSDIQITFVDAPPATEERHQFYVSALSGEDETIDIYWINDEWTDEFAEAGYLFPLNNKITIDKSRYIVDADKRFSYNNTLYALPVGTDMDVLFYRSDLISEVPDTWGEIVDMCRNSNWGAPIKLGLERNDIRDIIYNIIQIKNSTEMEYADILNIYKELISRNETEYTDSITEFKTGASAVYMGKISLWDKFNSDTSAVKGNVGVKMLPGADEEKSTNLVGCYGLAINANSKNKEAAVRFLDFMNSKEQQSRLSRDTSVMPIIKELFEDEMVLENMGYVEEAEQIIPKAESYKDVRIDGEKLKAIENALTEFFNNEETANNTGEILKDLL